MSRTIKRGLQLDCGCCGLFFTTWNGYQDQDQDCDYGICSECQGEGAVKSEQFYNEAVKIVMEALGPKAKARNLLRLKDPDFKYNLVNQAIDQGLLKYEITTSTGEEQ